MTDEKILLVDDDPYLLKAFSRLLRNFFVIETALGGEKGLESNRTNGPYAVVVSDMNMPEMNGVQFISNLKQIAPDSVCILLSGQCDKNDIIEALGEDGLFCIVDKPCNWEHMRQAIEDGIERYLDVRSIPPDRDQQCP